MVILPRDYYFSIHDFFSNTKGFLLNERLRYCDKKYSTVNRNIPSLFQKLIRYHSFSETPKGSNKNFWEQWDKIFSTAICVGPSIRLKIFDTGNSLKHQKCLRQRKVAVLRQKLFDCKSWYPPLLLSKKFIVTRNFQVQKFFAIRTQELIY